MRDEGRFTSAYQVWIWEDYPENFYLASTSDQGGGSSSNFEVDIKVEQDVDPQPSRQGGVSSSNVEVDTRVDQDAHYQPPPEGGVSSSNVEVDTRVDQNAHYQPPPEVGQMRIAHESSESKARVIFEDLVGLVNILIEAGQLFLGLVFERTKGRGVNIYTIVCVLLSLASILMAWKGYTKAAKSENCDKIYPWLPIYRYRRNGTLFLNFPRGLSIFMSIARFLMSTMELVQRLLEKDPNVPTASLSLMIAVVETAHAILLRHYLSNHLYVRCLHARNDYPAAGKRIGDRTYLIACPQCCGLHHRIPNDDSSEVANDDFEFPGDDFFRTSQSREEVLAPYNP